MSDRVRCFAEEHLSVSRRYFVQSGLVSVAALSGLTLADEISPELKKAIDDIEPWLTAQDDFRDVSRGKPTPHTLSDMQRREAGLTRDTWKLNVTSDPVHPARIKQSLEGDTAFTFEDLMNLAKDHAVRFPKVMTCLNIGCPLGNGIWEGVPLRDVVWKTQPTEDLRRVFYYGFHNNDPEQMFRSSLPVSRVLEDPFGLPPVILCYKLNGEWLTPERGGPVRVVVPEAYGFKSIKWLTNVVLSNISHANDTYADRNNDVDSPLKTFCATLAISEKAPANTPIPVTGWAQAGIAGLKKVQVWIHESDQKWSDDDPLFTTAPWQDATILSPDNLGTGLPGDQIPSDTIGFDSSGQPKQWPVLLTQAHWAILHKGLPSGKYAIRCRTIDGNGQAQPMPRPFRKSGHAAIEVRRFEVV